MCGANPYRNKKCNSNYILCGDVAVIVGIGKYLLNVWRYEKMGFSKIEIKTKGEAPAIFTEISIDGHVVHGVRSFELKQDKDNGMPIVTLDFNALDLSVDCEVEKMSQAYRGEIKEIIFA